MERWAPLCPLTNVLAVAMACRAMGRYMSHRVVAIAILLAFCIGYPLGSLLLTHCMHNKAHAARARLARSYAGTAHAMAFLTQGYTPKWVPHMAAARGGGAHTPHFVRLWRVRRYHYFGSLLLLRKLLVIAVSVFLKGSPYQIVAAIFVLGVFLGLLVRLQCSVVP